MADLTVRIDDDLLAQVREAAAEDERSVNGEIIWFIRQGLAARGDGLSGKSRAGARA